MKVLRINADGSSDFSVNGTDFTVITEVSRDHVLELIKAIMNDKDNVIEMDDPNSYEISNEAQKIIYQDLFIKFNSLVADKEKILAEVLNEIEPVLNKYNLSIDIQTDEAE